MRVADEGATPSGVTLRAEGLTKIYQTGEVQVTALDEVDLDLYAGEMVVLLGPPAAASRRC